MDLDVQGHILLDGELQAGLQDPGRNHGDHTDRVKAEAVCQSDLLFHEGNALPFGQLPICKEVCVEEDIIAGKPHGVFCNEIIPHPERVLLRLRRTVEHLIRQ